MSDAVIITLIIAACFVFGLLLHRRKQAVTSQGIPPNVADGWFASNPAPPAKTPSPRALSLSPRRHTLSTSAVISPQGQNEHGWPAVAVEYFPAVGAFEIDDIGLTAFVEATYESPDLPDLKKIETVQNPPELELVYLQPADRDRIKARFTIGSGILQRARQGLPEGYDPIAKSVSVDIVMELTGRAEQ